MKTRFSSQPSQCSTNFLTDKEFPFYYEVVIMMLFILLLPQIIGASKVQARDFLKGSYANWTIDVTVTRPEIISLTSAPLWRNTTRNFSTKSQGFLVQFNSLDLQCDQLALFIQTKNSSMIFCDQIKVKFVAFFEPEITLLLAKRKFHSRDLKGLNVGFNVTVSVFDNQDDCQYENEVKICGDFCLHQSVTCPQCLNESGHCEVQGKERVLLRMMHHHRSPILTSETNVTSVQNITSETSQERLGYLGIALKKLQETKVESDDEGIIFCTNQYLH